MNQIDQVTSQLEEHFIGQDASPKLHSQRSSAKSLLQHLLARCLNPYVLLMCLMAGTLLILSATSLHPTDVQIQGMGDGMKHVTIPFEEHAYLSGQNGKDAIVTGTFSYGLFSQHIVHITPNDCLEFFQINGVDVDLHTVIAGNTCDGTNGFDIDVKSSLKAGTNHFEIGLRDSDWLGLSFTRSSYDRFYFVLILLLLLEGGTLLSLFFKHVLRLPQEIVIIILLGLLVHLLYWSYTPYNLRTYDITEYGGHLDYIKHIAQSGRLPQLPDPAGDWEYHQPPLYYLTAAVIYTLSNTLGLDHQIVLQGVSLGFFLVFLLFGVLMLRIVCKRKWVFFTSTALLVCWPSGMIHSIRIGNDVMYYMLSVIALYFLLRWLLDKQSQHFYAAALGVALIIATKLTGLIALGVLLCVCLGLVFKKMAVRVSRDQLKQAGEKRITMASLSHSIVLSLKRPHIVASMKQTLFFLSVVILALALSLFRSVNIVLHEGHYDLLVSNISENNSGLYVGNALDNYIHFDLGIYLKQAFTDTWHDEGGRQYFFNFFFKSMLFGEFSFPSAAGQLIAKLQSALLLQMIIFLFIGLFMSIRRLESSHLLMMIWLILSLLALLYTRHSYPVSGFADFRYIFPAIVPFLFLYVTGIDWCIERKFRILGGLGYLLAFLFIIGSCVFFIIPLAM